MFGATIRSFEGGDVLRKRSLMGGLKMYDTCKTTWEKHEKKPNKTFYIHG